MQISVDPTKLSKEQREAVAGFILSYPSESTERYVYETEPAGDTVVTEPTGDTVVTEPTPEAAFGIVVPQAITEVNTSVELDKAGLPWDARIHAESKNKIADGTWRKKRNLDPALLATVEAELKQLMGVPAPTATPVAPPPPPAQVAEVAAPAESLAIPAFLDRSKQPEVPKALAAPVAPAVNQDPRGQFVALIGRTSAALSAGKITQNEVTQICTASGVAALPLLSNRLDLLPQIAAGIDALIARVK